jgi:hypothetical protein
MYLTLGTGLENVSCNVPLLFAVDRVISKKYGEQREDDLDDK